jgi:imidazolonepropionase-like amidohydrolase
VNPALFLGRPNEGIVRPGAIANLLLLEADPLADVGNVASIDAVILRGEWHVPGELASAVVSDGLRAARP